MLNREPEVAEALAAYDLGGAVIDIKPYGQGHINNTYAITVQREDGVDRRFLLQSVNTHVFRRPAEVMENIVNVTSYLKRKIAKAGGDEDREALTVILTAAGKPFYTSASGGFWRLYRFIEGVISYEKVEDKAVFAAVAEGFGHFAALLIDYPADSLYVTIPNFHDTRVRIQQLLMAAEVDVRGRAARCPAELNFALERKQYCGVLMDQLDAGALPLRVTHNDTKLNNVLIDPISKKAVCVIDLDTVMPGLLANDFGEAVRTGASTAEEDSPDLDHVHFDLSLYQSYSEHYLKALGDALDKREIESLPWGARMMTYENGIRFLTDYIAGDTYYKTDYDDHNLVRCRNQFKLLIDMEAQWEDMKLAMDNGQ